MPPGIPFVKIAESVNTIFHGKELKRIEEKQKRGEQLTKSEMDDAVKKSILKGRAAILLLLRLSINLGSLTNGRIIIR